jgi:hypothetical protein
MSEKQLFVLVSTGQQVANLPPVLERAQTGDRVLWVESAQARARSWSAGARAVLAGAGLVNLSEDVEVDALNDPVEVARACRPAVQKWQSEGLRPVLVTNGGLKLTPVGLLRAWEGQTPVVLYGESEPAVLRSFDDGLEQPSRLCAYERHQLDLPDILRASGHEFTTDSRHRRLWPAPSVVPGDIHDEPYGVDAEYTGRLHRDHQLWAAARGRSRNGDVPFAALSCLLPAGRLERWRRALGEVVRLTEANQEAILGAIYGGTVNLMREAELAQSRQELTEPSGRLGSALERAVARRVVAWVDRHGRHLVQSVWCDVGVARQGQPGTPIAQIAQWDVLLVLKNGILLHLECKAATADPKDLDARLFRLQQAGSQLARMVLCVPLFTAFAGEPWFTSLWQSRLLLEQVGRRDFLPLTLPGQPTEFTLAGQGPRPVESFEEALEEFLSRYRPPTA